MASTTTADKASTTLSLAASPAPTLLKTDCLGRVRSTPEQRAAVLAEFDRSGLSAARFARLVGIKYTTFASWNQQRRRKGPTPSARPSAGGSLRLVEAVAEPPARTPTGCGEGLLLQLPGGASLELSAPDQAPLAASLIQALAGRC